MQRSANNRSLDPYQKLTKDFNNFKKNWSRCFSLPFQFDEKDVVLYVFLTKGFCPKVCRNSPFRLFELSTKSTKQTTNIYCFGLTIF